MLGINIAILKDFDVFRYNLDSKWREVVTESL